MMWKDKRMLYVNPNGMKDRIIDKVFKYYLYFCLAWVTFALGFDIFMIIKHFDEF